MCEIGENIKKQELVEPPKVLIPKPSTSKNPLEDIAQKPTPVSHSKVGFDLEAEPEKSGNLIARFLSLSIIDLEKLES